MNNRLLHQVVALPVLLAINLAQVIFLKSTLRYLLPIAVWTALLASFFVLAKWNIREGNRIGNAYWASAKRTLFWWTRTLFIALAIGWLVLAALWAIVPTGPLL
jgi:hypothetical protein